MTWSISFSGHIEQGDTQEVKDKCDEIERLARKFYKAVRMANAGASSATFYRQDGTNVSLVEAEDTTDQGIDEKNPGGDA